MIKYIHLFLSISIATGLAMEKPTALKGTFTIPFKPGMEKVHPRLLFTKADMKRWWQEDKTPQQFIWEAGKSFFKTCRDSVPKNEEWNTGDWQRISWWRGLTAVLAYAKSGYSSYAKHATDLLIGMCKSEHWGRGGEMDYGMASGNIMAFVALAYDVCYNLLTPPQRKLVQERLWLAADRFYHYGWTEKKKREKRSVRYWQGDPQNNHRWHRLCGYLLGTLAIYGEVPGINGYVAHAIKEAELVLKWLPPDGSCHESVGYQAFGTQYLVPTIVALDRCLGTNHLGTHRAFREFPHVRAHMVVPDRKGVWSYGDGGEGVYYFNHYNFKCASVWKDKYMQAAHLANFKAAPRSYIYHGLTLLWHDPTLPAGDLTKYPTHRYLPDLGIATFRQNWKDPDGLAVFFKCGPYGGHLLNEYRNSFKKPHYVNVAHDHPDANEFMIAWKGEFFAQDLGTKKRLTSQHSTIMVNGKHQAGHGLGWTQPIPNMGERAQVKEYFGTNTYGMVRGEAGKFYADLKKFARTFLYVDGAYLLVADEIQAKTPSTIDWYYKCRGDWIDAGNRQWDITKGNGTVRIYMAAPAGVKDTLEEDGLLVTKEKVRDTRFLCLISPLKHHLAQMKTKKITGQGFIVNIERGQAKDLITIGPVIGSRKPAVSTDADVMVLTTKKGKPDKLLIVNGSHVKCEGLTFTASLKVNALVEVPDSNMILGTPLGEVSRKTIISMTGLVVTKANQQKLVGDIKKGVGVKVPTWQEYQDEVDGFKALAAKRKK